MSDTDNLLRSTLTRLLGLPPGTPIHDLMTRVKALVERDRETQLFVAKRVTDVTTRLVAAECLSGFAAADRYGIPSLRP